MRVRDYVVLAQSLPPRRIIQKGIERIRRRIREYFRKWGDSKRSTYVFPIPYKIDKLYSYFSLPSLRRLQMKAGAIAGVTQHVLDHRFNLLGSGWVQVKHGMMCVGIEGIRYQMGMRILAEREGHWLKEWINPSNLKMRKKRFGSIPGF